MRRKRLVPPVILRVWRRLRRSFEDYLARADEIAISRARFQPTFTRNSLETLLMIEGYTRHFVGVAADTFGERTYIEAERRAPSSEMVAHRAICREITVPVIAFGTTGLERDFTGGACRRAPPCHTFPLCRIAPHGRTTFRVRMRAPGWEPAGRSTESGPLRALPSGTPSQHPHAPARRTRSR